MTFSKQSKDALRTRLASGLNTRQIGELKQQQALLWIYRWGWSWPTVLEQISGSKNNRLTSKLVKNKLITTMTPENAGVKEVPKKIVVLSERGLQEVERRQEKLIRYELNPFRIRQTHIRHSVLAQQSTANMLKPGFEFRTERELTATSRKSVKQIDILWITNGHRAGIEIELTSKWKRELDQFVLSTILSLLPSENAPARLDSVLILTDCPSIKRNYEECFKPGHKFNGWEKEGTKNTGKWVISNRYTVPQEIDGKVLCQLFESF